MIALPNLMVAPNGARRMKADHPALPITLPEIVETARACAREGADGLHLHLRDTEGLHTLDAGLYREALTELRAAVPGMALQITTEAAGHYAAPHQRRVALESGAGLVSVALREMVKDTPDVTATDFYAECAARGIAVQHIMYDATEFDLLARLLPGTLLHDSGLQLLFVLGRYSIDQNSEPSDLTPFLTRMKSTGLTPDWAVCAFGRGETACLVEAHRRGGKLRVGFENSIWHDDGSLARDNAERVRQVHLACG
ncbi:3-keto-5-aminohexanoate cleavage protein [Roseovarius sp. A21]|uniref:3-keto-5-aminohexanoate cleavage protein n=1 Tax=Roseovarius bejariae TaxID=2576383 RepID=A0A844D0N5_9RHOB|nr:3-keto-5-aminohexanoate cleavage protein [Roseovarius bejariae]MRU15794.1 3-keto-5-aminohexanoate cleavage protein [Roseovarius bejariae]